MEDPMMGHIRIAELPEFVGQTVTVKGWVQTRRDQKSVQFILLRDHTGLVQVVVERNDGHADRLFP